MAYRKLIVPVTGGDRDYAVVKAALDIAKAYESWVTALFVKPDVSEVLPYLGEGISAGVVQEILDASDEAATRSLAVAKDAVKRAAQDCAVPLQDGPPAGGKASVSIKTRQGILRDVLFEEASLADLFVFDGAAMSEQPNIQDALETVMLSARRPVILVPKTVWGPIGGKVAIGWDGGLAAAHAVTDAIPWLKRARSVEIVSVGHAADNTAEMDRLRDYLRLHGITAIEHSLQAGDLGAGAALTEAATRSGADLLVMGGYGHSRLRELILGGVTRHILNNVTIPVFMSH